GTSSHHPGPPSKRNLWPIEVKSPPEIIDQGTALFLPQRSAEHFVVSALARHVGGKSMMLTKYVRHPARRIQGFGSNQAYTCMSAPGIFKMTGIRQDRQMLNTCCTGSPDFFVERRTYFANVMACRSKCCLIREEH